MAIQEIHYTCRGPKRTPQEIAKVFEQENFDRSIRQQPPLTQEEVAALIPRLTFKGCGQTLNSIIADVMKDGLTAYYECPKCGAPHCCG